MAAGPPVTFTFNGGADLRVGAVTTDAAGNSYFTGSVNSSSFPATPNAFQTKLTSSECVGSPTYFPPCSDAFVVKLDPYGNIVWATYLGGNGGDSGTAIAIDGGGNVFVAGTTYPDLGSVSVNTFPITAGAAFGPPPAKYGAAFITKLSADGSHLIYSTFLPGGISSSVVAAMTIDSSVNAYVAYQSNPALTIPTTPGAFQPVPQDQGAPGVVVKLNASGSALVYATYLSGYGQFSSSTDAPLSIAVDGAGNAVIAGTTGADSFPVTPGAWSTTDPDPGAATGFVSKLNAGGTALIYSTYFGGGANVVKLDSSGNAYVLGADGPPGIPVLAELSADGSSVLYFTQVPGAASIALDPVGNAYVVGTNPTAAATVFVERFAPNGVLSGMETIGGPPVYEPGASYAANDSANAIAVAPNGSVAISGTAISGVFPGITQAPALEGLAYVTSFFITATVMNAANYVPGVVAPGEIVTILGEVGGGITSVYFDGFRAPVLYLSGHQINAQVPWEIAGQPSTRLSINWTLTPMDAGTIGPFVVAVAPSVPGVFYVTNSDGSVNSAANAAARGDFVTIYGTGGGVMSPTGITGGLWPDAPLASFTLPVTITVGGESGPVIYAGSAPTLLSGFFQINVRVPQDLTPSASTPMVLNIGTGQTTVPVAIK
jgi:uncharacterized protein (TIGR03437 family)